MTLFELAATLSLDTTSFNRGVNQASETGKNFANTLSQNVTAKAVALGNALYKAAETGARALINLGKSAVTAAAEVAAENAQFEAAFGDIQKAASNVFNAIGRDTNILATRLRGVGTKAFSQFKGAGLEAVDALAATDKYTRLAADAAAYYDISLEAADERLRSFLRGNTEAGDAIGLFTSESQRNTYAMEQYGKKWQDLTEAQRQMLMLNVAEDIYAQSGAIGQAERESSNWANTVANLNEAWRLTLAKLANPLTDALTPFLENITAKLGDEKLQAGIALVAEKLGEIAGTSLDTVSAAVGALLGDLDSINKWEITWDETIAPSATAGANAIIDAINYVYATNIPHIDTVDFPTWDKVESAAKVSWEAIKTGLNGLIEFTRFEAKFFGFSDWTEDDTTKVREWWNKAFESISSIVQYELNFSLPSASSTVDAITRWWSSVKSKLSGKLFFSVAPVITGGISSAGKSVSTAVTEATGSDLAGALSESIVQNSTVNPDNPFGNAIQSIVNLFKPKAIGLDYVPHNDYLARLHEGEAVLTKSEANAWRRGEGQGVDVSGIVSAVVQGVREGMRGLAINMDGQAVGDVVTDRVSRNIAQAAWAGRYSG